MEIPTMRFSLSPQHWIAFTLSESVIYVTDAALEAELQETDDTPFLRGEPHCGISRFFNQPMRRPVLLDSTETLGDLATLRSNRLETLPWIIVRRPPRSAQHLDHRAMVHLLPLDGRRAVRRRDHGLSLREL